MDLNKNSTEDGKTQIKLNRKMRMWHKYRNFCIAGVGIVVVLFLIAVIYKGIRSIDKQSAVTTAQNHTTQSTAAQATTVEQTTAAQATIAQTTAAATQAPTAAPVQTSTYAVAGPAVAQEYTSKDYFAGSVFLGDSVVSGISYYNYLPAAQVFADGKYTTDKTASSVDSIVAANPTKVFIMLGLNDLNYGTRSADQVVSNLAGIVSQIKTALPSTNVYVLSLLPITQAFEAKTTVHITQAAINDVNDKLSQQAASMNCAYIDVATPFKDGSGYLTASFTGNGSNIYNEYYPFLLNGIAGAVK